MKPREFDELVRKKFDQNDFAYSPAQWDRLAEQMDGRAKKRSMMLWWWVPAVGIAASVALAIGIGLHSSPGLQHSGSAGTEMAQANHIYHMEQGAAGTGAVIAETGNGRQAQAQMTAAMHKVRRHSAKAAAKEDVGKWFSLTMETADAATRMAGKHAQAFTFIKKEDIKVKKEKKELKEEGFYTFKPQDAAAPAPKTSVILSGGINHGYQSNGYLVGATARHMITDKLYIESDVAVSSSSNTQATKYFVPAAAGSAGTLAAKMTAKTLSPTAKTDAQSIIRGTVKTSDVDYNLYYAQVSPSLGYKLLKRLSVGAGPDFQQMLADNRPALSTVDRSNLQTAPGFDVGFIGKTEYTLTKKVKAAVYYREGLNNVITPTNSKYIDRNYVQFQLKYTIFNK